MKKSGGREEKLCFLAWRNSFYPSSPRLSLEEVSRNAELTMEQTRQLMGAVGEAVEKAPVEEGKVQGMKVNNIFISSSWVIKIQENHRKQKFG